MIETPSMISDKNYNLRANEDFVISFTSKLNTCFIDGFTSKIKSYSFAYLPNGSEHIYWILDLEGEVHSIWDLYKSGLQDARAMIFLKSGSVGITFRSGP